MNAKTQYQLSAGDMEIILAVVRSGTLAEAGARLGVDGSTVFRAVQRVEKGLGQRLFDRSRTGYRPTELALRIAGHAECMEAELEAARTAAQAEPGTVTGCVRLSTTDTILHGLVLPVLHSLAREHPLLQLELTASNELASLTRRDADIALRASRRPPDHLVGRRIGPIRVALFAPAACAVGSIDELVSSGCAWIAPDEALPEHPSVQWRKRHLPKVEPRYKVNSILAVMEAVAAGLGAGIVPLFLAQGRGDVVQVTAPLDECETPLWLLAHPESRHLRRISAVYNHLAAQLALE